MKKYVFRFTPEAARLISHLHPEKKNLAPLCFAIGMLEYWNVGILGSGKMEKCLPVRRTQTGVIGETLLDIEAKKCL